MDCRIPSEPACPQVHSNLRTGIWELSTGARRVPATGQTEAGFPCFEVPVENFFGHCEVEKPEPLTRLDSEHESSDLEIVDDHIGISSSGAVMTLKRFDSK